MRTGPFLAIAISALVSLPRGEAGQPLVEWKSLPKDAKARLEKALNSTFHYKLDSGVDCTGTYISNTGHFVTALHCISGCLSRNKVLDRELAIEEPTKEVKYRRSPSSEEQLKKIYSYKYTIDDDVVAEGGLVCPGVLGERRVDMKVVLTGGKGWLAPKNTLAEFSKRYPTEYRALLDQGYEHDGDFAVLQALETKTAHCLPLAAQGPGQDQALHAVSYPCLARGELVTNGTTPLYTSGKRTAGFKDSELYRRAGREGIEFSPEIVNRADTFFSTLDIERCGSGTAVLDQSLAVVGVATRIYKSDTKYEKGSLESVSAARIWKDLRAKKTKSELKEIICAQPSAAETTVLAPAPRAPSRKPASKR